MKPLPLAGIAGLLLAACAAPETRWDKPGATEAMLKEDTEQCRLQARLAPLPPRRPASPSPSMSSKVLERGEERAREDAENFQKCMREKGYSPAQ
jgi:hypothetical protein